MKKVKSNLSEETANEGTMDPYGILSDESYIRGMNDGPERTKLMNKYGLKDDPKNPGVYASQGRNFRGHKEHR